jgi:molecular chaperone DnaK
VGKIGIHFGIRSLSVAYIKEGLPNIVVNELGESKTQSAFRINNHEEIQVGTIALQFYPSYPRETVLEVQRYMGSENKLMVAGKEYRPAEIAAYILRYLKLSAENVLGTQVTEAVITVPVHFSDLQRKATQKACDYGVRYRQKTKTSICSHGKYTLVIEC